MKTGKISTLLAFIILIAIVVGTNYIHFKWMRGEKQETAILDSLRFLKNKMVTFDSIQSASQNRFLDSLHSMKTNLQNEKLQRTKGDAVLRKKNQDLENRFDSIVLPDRPDF